MDIRTLIRKIPDYPAPHHLLRPHHAADGRRGFHALVDELAARYAQRGIRKFACMEWRGFVLGAALAYRLGAGFVPIRKLGKLPANDQRRARVRPYVRTAGNERGCHRPGESVVLVDDMLATGAVSEAASMLIKEVGGNVVECCFVTNSPPSAAASGSRSTA